MVLFTQTLVRLNLRQIILTLVAFAAIGISPRANAQILSEAYSKVLLGGVHVGYTIQRYEFDPKKKEFVITYFVKTGPKAGDITESVKGRSTSSLKPISYQYTQLAGDKAKMIDATFKDDTMSTTVVENGKRTVLAPRKIPKDAFLSSFLGYMMLQGKEGIKPQIRYTYNAIAEEDGQVYQGEAFVAGEESVAGVNSYKVLNTFMKTNFIYWITPKGEFIASRSPVQQLSTEVVAGIQDAIAGLPLNSATLNQLFGSVPKGTENAVAKKNQGVPLAAPATVPAAAPPAAPAVEEASTPRPTKKEILEGAKPPVTNPGKKEGVPAGQGIQLKGGSGQ
ncbi:MAG TPA: hypothetical protein VM432_07420 [Bdellovibrionales bacterium]|nr:hypothetical protein [Bdellovibrionales bacterium]